jgi:hypothetical protein
MYTVEDETFRRAREIVTALSRELTSQEASGSSHPVDLGELVRSVADRVQPGGEAEYVRVIADRLDKSFPIEELFPRKRRAPSA